MNIPPLGPLIDKVFKVYVDEKDAGPLVLTNIYLMAGGKSLKGFEGQMDGWKERRTDRWMNG